MVRSYWQLKVTKGRPASFRGVALKGHSCSHGRSFTQQHKVDSVCLKSEHMNLGGKRSDGEGGADLEFVQGVKFGQNPFNAL